MDPRDDKEKKWVHGLGVLMKIADGSLSSNVRVCWDAVKGCTALDESAGSVGTELAHCSYSSPEETGGEKEGVTHQFNVATVPCVFRFFMITIMGNLRERVLKKMKTISASDLQKKEKRVKRKIRWHFKECGSNST